MAPRRRGLLATLGNAVALGPFLLASPAWGTMHGVAFVGLVSLFAWSEAATCRGDDISTGPASRGPLLTALCLLALFILALVTASPNVPLVLAAPGAALMLAGIALRYTAMVALGPAFVSELRPIPTRDRVRHGPYASLQHPSELGLLALATGATLLLASLPAAIACAIAFVPLVLARMHHESRAAAIFD